MLQCILEELYVHKEDFMTPHIEAKENEIAKIVIMPGDPLRAKYIAENFLEDAKLLNIIDKFIENKKLCVNFYYLLSQR